MVDWPDQLFEFSNFQFQVNTPDQSYDFHDCELDLISMGGQGVVQICASSRRRYRTFDGASDTGPR